MLVLVAMIVSLSTGVRLAVGAPAPKHADDPPPAAPPPAAPPPAAQPQIPEIRPSSPQDEALKKLIGQRTSTRGITLSSAPATRPHKVLGTVSVEAPAPTDGSDTKPGPNLYLNELLRSRAIKLYGEKKVDGIMSVTYEPAREGKIRANGTAVHFENPSGGKK